MTWSLLPPPGADPGGSQRDTVNPGEISYQDLLRLPFKDGGRSPAEGFDCWGLVKYVLERMGHTGVPEFAYDTALDASNVGALIARERAARATRTTADEIGALVVIRNHPKFVNHVGVIVAPGRFLHVLRQSGVVVDHAGRPPWVRRIQGFYRLKEHP